MKLQLLLDGVAKGDLVFRQNHYTSELYTFDCTLAFYNSMADLELGDCVHCRFYASNGCNLPTSSQLKHHIPYLREHHPELFI